MTCSSSLHVGRRGEVPEARSDPRPAMCPRRTRRAAGATAFSGHHGGRARDLPAKTALLRSDVQTALLPDREERPRDHERRPKAHLPRDVLPEQRTGEDDRERKAQLIDRRNAGCGMRDAGAILSALK